jgi:hypothetical protein
METSKSKENAMKSWRNTGFIVLSLFAALFLVACGGGGGDSTAPPTPVVVTGSATGITNVGATLNGSVNPNGLATEVWFEWGTSPTLATFDNTVPKQTFPAGTTVQSVSAPITGLTFGTTYYFRLAASNSSGVTKGVIGNFSTSAQRPTVTTLAADNLAATSATLHGGVNPNLLATDAWFEYGPNATLATFSKSTDVPIGSGSAVVPTSFTITGQPFGGTVFFRAAARNNAGEQKGNLDNVSMLNPPPVANAGADNSVLQGKTGTLDGSGSTTPSGAITSYLWTQVNGTPVTLSDNTAVKPTFTAPTVTAVGAVLRFQLTVTDSRSMTASDNVDITVKWGFLDDFSTNTTGQYGVTTFGTPGTFTWVNQGAEVVNGGANGLTFSPLSPLSSGSSQGVFTVDFHPTTRYGSHGGFWIILRQDANNNYEISNFDWGAGTPTAPDQAAIRKYVGGVMVNEALFPATGYTQGGTYNIKITFSPTQVTLEGFGGAVSLNPSNTTAISVSQFSVETGLQDASYDNIQLVVGP